MELIRCHAQGFGCLCDLHLDFRRGLNAICMENGSGKSTLCAFIKCMLYGLSETRKKDLTENERLHFLPWQGGEFGGSLTVSHEGRTYRITRRFGKRPSEDLLEIFDEETGQKTDALGTCPGKTMLDMDAAGFASCAYFSERAFASAPDKESILSLLGAQNGKTEASLHAAIERLEEERRQYERRGGRGLLAETDEALARINERQLVLSSEAEGAREKERALLNAKAALSAHTLSQSSMKSEEEKARKQIRTLPLLFSLLLFLAAAGLSLFSLFALLMIFPAISLLCYSLFVRKANNNLQKCDTFANEGDTFEEKYRACNECQKAYEAAVSAAEELAYLTEEAARLCAERARMEARLSDIKKTEALLEEAGRRYREAGSKAILSRFKEALSMLGEKESEKFRLDDTLAPTLLSHDAYRSADALSRAGKDAVSLSRSLALLGALPSEKKPVLLFDDPFLCYDDRRLSGALRMLEALATDQQILYFTCSHSRMP